MNTETLARATFVLNKSAAEDLTYLSTRMGQSRSALVREILEPSVADLAALVRRIPDSPGPADAEQFRVALRGLLEMTYAHGLSQLEGPHSE